MGLQPKSYVCSRQALWSCFATVHLSCFGSSCVSGTIFWYLMNHMWFSYRHEYYRYESNSSVKNFMNTVPLEGSHQLYQNGNIVNSWHGTTLTPFSLGYVIGIIKYGAWTQGLLAFVTWHFKYVWWLNESKEKKRLKLSLC